MTEEMKERERSKALQFIAGNQPETNKFEVKRQWYKLKEKNTNQILNTNVIDSGCADSSQIKDIVDANIDVPIRFDIDSVEIGGKTLSVLHLAPSTQKPHYVLEYRNESSCNPNGMVGVMFFRDAFPHT